MNARSSRALLALAATGTVLAITAGPASAHVTATAPGAAQGGYAILTFSVPTERADDSTVKLKVALPGFKYAMPEAIAGWTTAVQTNEKKEITAVTWSAAPGTGIAPGQFQRFALSIGPLPKQDHLSFAAEQSYGKGEIVNWDQPERADGSEAEHPAPEIQLGAAKSGDDHHAADAAATAESHDSDTIARWLGGIGLALGIAGLAAGAVAILRGRRS